MKRLDARAALTCAILALVLPPAAARACLFTSLASGVPQPANGAQLYYRFTQDAARWSVVGIRPYPSEDWDLGLYASTNTDPGCVTNQLATSNEGTGVVDFVVADFHTSSPGMYFVAANRFAGAIGGTIEWDGSPGTLSVDGAALNGSTGAADVVKLYEVDLVEGGMYVLDFFAPAGSGLHLMLFRNPTGGPYFAPRGFRELDVTAGTTYNAPATGTYAVVITNGAAARANFSLTISTSTCAIPTTLAANTPTPVAAPSARLAFDAALPTWNGIAVRAAPSDWDITVYDQPTGGPMPLCFHPAMVNSIVAGSVVDVAVLDNTWCRTGWYFANATLSAGAGPATVEALQPTVPLAVNDGAHPFAMDAAELAKIHVVTVQAGHEYQVVFQPGAPGLTLLAFRNPFVGPYTAGRPSALFSSTGNVTFTPVESGPCALVVVNDGAVTTNYSLAVGECGAVATLASGVATPVTGQNGYARFTQAGTGWVVAGVQPAAGGDANLLLGADHAASPWPSCAAGAPLAASALAPSRQDFVVGDFHANAPGTYYLHGVDSVDVVPGLALEWEGNLQTLVPNDNNIVQWYTGADDFVRAYDVALTAGQSYEFSFVHPAEADLHLCLFRNGAAGAYWAGRDAAEFETATSQAYVAPATGTYGVVLVNDNGESDAVYPAVRTCDPTVALAAGGTTSLAVAAPEAFVSFTPTQSFWSALAVRPDGAGGNWDLDVWDSPTGGPAGTCFSGLVGTSTLADAATDVVLGDFDSQSPPAFYGLARRVSGGSPGYVQFRPGSQSLALDGSPQVRAWGAHDLVEVWDVTLSLGQTCGIQFTHDPGLDAHVAVFEPQPVTHWVERGNADAEDTGSFDFTAPVSGSYAIAVVNDGGAGGFSLGVYPGPLAVEGAARPARDAFAGLSPNPGRGTVRLEYALRDAARVTFEVLDMAGRVVSRLEPGERGAGTWTAAWDTRDRRGTPLPAGLYFVRMRAGDRTVGLRKMALLE